MHCYISGGDKLHLKRFYCFRADYQGRGNKTYKVATMKSSGLKARIIGQKQKIN